MLQCNVLFKITWGSRKFLNPIWATGCFTSAHQLTGFNRLLRHDKSWISTGLVCPGAVRWSVVIPEIRSDSDPSQAVTHKNTFPSVLLRLLKTEGPFGDANPTQIKFCLISTIIHFWLLILSFRRNRSMRGGCRETFDSFSSTPKKKKVNLGMFPFSHWSCLISFSCWKQNTAAVTNFSVLPIQSCAFW